MKKEESYEVEILKTFRSNLSKRFNYRNAVKGEIIYYIEIGCDLCYQYYTPIGESCSKCPFFKFHTPLYKGCTEWIMNISEIPYSKINGEIIKLTSVHIWWKKENDTEAEELLKTLRKRAKKLITFV